MPCHGQISALLQTLTLDPLFHITLFRPDDVSGEEV